MGKLNFRIVDGDPGLLDKKYEEFKRLYVECPDLTLDEIRKRCGVSTNHTKDFLDRVYEEAGYSRSGKRGGG